MIGKEDFVKIKAMKAAGMYQKDIASALSINERTVRRALKRDAAPKPTRAKRGSKLDAYREQVDEMLSRGVWNGAVILSEIKKTGYDGGRTVLREYIQSKRGIHRAQERATVRFETPPGKQLQSDWGEERVELGGAECKVCFIVNTLGWSRRFHFWCTDSLDAEHTYEGLIRSFEYFGGVTGEVLLDNQKTAVMTPRHHGEAARFTERFLDLAAWYGFEPKACMPYRARTKGKDERMVGYIRHNFFARHASFESWAHLNQLAEQWLREEADARVHGTVKEVVAERFERERPSLQPLPARRYDTAYLERRMVGWDGYIEVRGNRYSVPGDMAGRPVRIRIGLDGMLSVLADELSVVLAQHQLTDQRGVWITDRTHHSELWSRTLASTFQVHDRALQAYQEVAG
jgi:transposase